MPKSTAAMLDHRYRYETGGCPIEATLDVLAGRWKCLLLYKILEEPRRFRDLRREVPHVSSRMLARQLRELERDGLVKRHEHAPAHVAYAPTAISQRLRPALWALREWGDAYLAARVAEPASGTARRARGGASRAATPR